MNPIFELTNFAPFVQFVAGIYLVFLYDEVFKCNPLKAQVNSLDQLLHELVNENQGFLSEEEAARTVEFKAKRDSRWEDRYYSLKRISFSSFLFSLFLLFYIGVEKWMLGNDWEQSLIMPSIVLILYNSILFFVPGKDSFFKNDRFAGFLFISLLAYVILFCLLDNCIDIFPLWNKTLVYCIALFSMSFGMLLYAGNLIHKCVKFAKIEHRMKVIRRKMNLYISIKMGIKKFDALGWVDRYIIMKKAFESNGKITDVVDEFIRDTFKKSFNKIISK